MPAPAAATNTPLWIDRVPPDIQLRVAQYVCDRKSGRDALNLAKASATQRRAVCAALDNTLTGSFATHADGLVGDWVDVFEDVRVLELREHPPNFRLLSAPSLRVLMIEDEPLQLEALAKSRVQLDRLELTIRFNTPAYLVCRFLAEVSFKTFVLRDIQVRFFEHLDPAELVAACKGVETVIFEGHCWIHAGVADFVTNLSSLRELMVDIQGIDSIAEILPVMQRLDRIRIIGWDSQLCQLIRLSQTHLKELYLMSFEGWGDDDVVAFGEVIDELSELEKLTVKLLWGVESLFPQMHFLTNLEIHWRQDLEVLNNRNLYYKPKEGTVPKMIEGLPSLTALRMFSVRLSEDEVVNIIERLGRRLKEFGLSSDAQDVPPHRRVSTVIESLTTHTCNLTQLEVRHGYWETISMFADTFTWKVKQEMLLRLDRLHRQSPDLDLEEVEDLVMRWPYEYESDGSEDEKQADAREKTLALRRCRRGMNEDGGLSHVRELAGLLETGCEGLEQDLDAATELYKQAVRMGDTGDAILKLWDLTEKDSFESSKPKTGGALELMLEMDRRKLKTLPHFADAFWDGTWSGSPHYQGAERVLQLAVDRGYIIPFALRLAKLVEKGYDDVPPNPGKAVDLYRLLVDYYEDIDALFWLADWLSEGYGNEPPNPAEARIYLERGVRKRCSYCMNFLGVLLQEGYKDFPPNPEEAIDMFEQAIEHGNNMAIVNLAILYADGFEGNPSNPYKAIELLETAIAKDRHPVALRQLGNLMETGYDDQAPDAKRAAELYEEAIDGGSKWACTDLATLVAYGYDDVPPNPDEAVRLYEKVIEEGTTREQVSALRNLGHLLLQGSGDLKPDPKRAAECYRKAIDRGDSSALLSLGNLLRCGRGDVSPDPVEACRLYQRAIEDENDPSAMRKLASLIKHGFGDVKPDPVRAVELYRRAIDAGCVTSCSSLGKMFQEGYENVPQDLERAAELYKEGVDGGDPESMCRLGVMLEEGFGNVYPDPVAAIELYNQAINEHKYGKAMRYLGRTLEDGYLDKPPNPEAAKDLFERGASSDDPWSKVCLATLLHDGYADVKPDIDRARVMYSNIIAEDDCEERISIAMCRLGHIIENAAAGDSVQLALAAVWYRRSIDKSENCSSLYRLAVLTRKGFDEKPPDIPAAVAMLRKAIEYEDNAKPFFELSDIIGKGYEDMKPDVAEAKRLAEEGLVALWGSLEINS